MKKVKILHCADLHFDTPFRELSKELSSISKEELLEVFSKIIDLSINENVQVILIGGDVFDNLTVNKNTLYFISKELERIKEKYVFIAPGNHDPYNTKSFYKMINWPENVHVFKGDMESKEIETLNLVVWGAAFREKYVREPLIKHVSVNNSKINIMVLHGDISNKNSTNDYNPIYLEDINNSGMDYIALGHRHQYSEIQKEGSTYYAYSGCPQGRGFDEENSKGVIIGDVFRGGVKLDFFTTCKREYVTCQVDISNCRTYDSVSDLIIINFNREKREKNLFKIILVGNISEEFNINEDVLFQKLIKEFYFLKIINKTKLKINVENLMNDYSVRGKFITKVMEKINSASEAEEEMLNRVLKLGLQSLSQEEVNLDDN